MFNADDKNGAGNNPAPLRLKLMAWAGDFAYGVGIVLGCISLAFLAGVLLAVFLSPLALFVWAVLKLAGVV